MNTLKFWMDARGVTITELCRHLGCARSVITSYLDGRRGFGAQHLMNIACALDVAPAEILPPTVDGLCKQQAERS